jgi:hypothetical protein
VNRSDASALADLQMHWDEAYAIGLDGDIWSAAFHGSTDELRAHTSTELRELIRADYAYRQHVLRVRAAAARTDLASDAPDDDHAGRSARREDTDRGGAWSSTGHEDSDRSVRAGGDGGREDNDRRGAWSSASHEDGDPGRAGSTAGHEDSDPGRAVGTAEREDSHPGGGTGVPDLDHVDLDDADLDDADLDEADFDDDDYAAHFDSAQLDSAQFVDSVCIDDAQIDRGSIGGGHRHDTESDQQAGLSRAPLARGGYANLRGERMST